jgi:hypothetical protein
VCIDATQRLAGLPAAAKSQLILFQNAGAVGFKTWVYVKGCCDRDGLHHETATQAAKAKRFRAAGSFSPALDRHRPSALGKPGALQMLCL